MRNSKSTGVFLMLFAVLGLCSCGGSSSSSNPAPNGQASVFTIGTDAPLPSVISCQIMVTGVTLNNGTTNVPVLTTPQVVDFAQLSGLHQLLDLNTVPTGTYTSATIPISAPTIGYLNSSTPPQIATMTGTLPGGASSDSVMVQLAQPFVLTANDLI